MTQTWAFSCCDPLISVKLRNMSNEEWHPGKVWYLPATFQSTPFVTCQINALEGRCKQKERTTRSSNLFVSNHFCLLGPSCKRLQWGSTFSNKADRSGFLSHLFHINANTVCVCESCLCLCDFTKKTPKIRTRGMWAAANHKKTTVREGRKSLSTCAISGLAHFTSHTCITWLGKIGRCGTYITTVKGRVDWRLAKEWFSASSARPKGVFKTRAVLGHLLLWDSLLITVSGSG